VAGHLGRRLRAGRLGGAHLREALCPPNDFVEPAADVAKNLCSTEALVYFDALELEMFLQNLRQVCGVHAADLQRARQLARSLQASQNRAAVLVSLQRLPMVEKLQGIL
jgi:hypothetical protein